MQSRVRCPKEAPVTLPPGLEKTLREFAAQHGLTPGLVVVEALQEGLKAMSAPGGYLERLAKARAQLARRKELREQKKAVSR